MEELLCLIALFVILVHVFQFGKKIACRGGSLGIVDAIYCRFGIRHSGIGIWSLDEGGDFKDSGYGITSIVRVDTTGRRGRVFALGYRREDGKFSLLFLLIFDFALRGRLDRKSVV